MKMLDTSTRLGEQAAAVAAQVEHDRLGALVEHLVDLGGAAPVRARAEAEQLDHADLLAVALDHAPGRDRDLDALALDLDGARVLAARA